MSVQSTYLPFDYPQYSSADFRASTMRPLFEYRARCAASGHLWTTMDETMATVATAAPVWKQTPPMHEEVECPLRDASSLPRVGDERDLGAPLRACVVGMVQSVLCDQTASPANPRI
jgi:hypothetical protein